MNLESMDNDLSLPSKSLLMPVHQPPSLALFRSCSLSDTCGISLFVP